jgi:hypothetical protein
MAKPIDITADFSELAEFIGTFQGAAKVLEDSKYMDALLTHAHRQASIQFDGDIAAYALATNTMGHMYEWGTAGINTGRTTRRMDPLSEGAKLWRHQLSGRGMTKEASFVFQPSVVPVPAPTVEITGVPRAQLRMLTGGPYVFVAKAAIMEAGTVVTIRPRGDNKLFVPFGKEGPRNPAYAGRTFIFTKGPIRTVPGKNYAGNFSKYWMVWWSSEGDKIMSESVQSAVDAKMTQLVDSLGRNMGNRPSRTTAATWKMSVDKARQFAERRMYGEMDRLV